jgi:bifunctional enzyme CysN/CysC
VEKALIAAGRPAYLLDADNVRHGLNGDLGFSAEDRAENVRRVAHVAQLMADAGLVVLAPVISPYRAGRRWARDIHRAAGLPFVEVFVDAPIEACMERDVKGLYARAISGEIPRFTGVSDPYEPPENPELHLKTDEETPETSVASVMLYLETNGLA